MVVTEKVHTTINYTLHQLIQQNPQLTGFVIEAFELLMYQNGELKKIASKYSHDLRSPVTNINMLLQLYDKSENDADKRLYVNKISNSLDRLQEGFEQLSHDRKVSLKRISEQSLVQFDKVFADIKAQSPLGSSIITEVDAGNEVWAQPRYFFNAFYLLCMIANDEGSMVAQTKKAWEGLQCVITYPAFMNLSGEAKTDDKEKQSGSTASPTSSWLYYFAQLFLGATGASSQVEENESEGVSKIIISFSQAN
ncbi:MAG: histidine kinase dimerization/phospho-acceptor domain-containing protein [Bacteroidota bacterium]